jgi:hypothetical protein
VLHRGVIEHLIDASVVVARAGIGIALGDPVEQARSAAARIDLARPIAVHVRQHLVVGG